jgi:hypothetical protein
MNFREFINLQEKTLYHGTVLDHEPSMRKIGIVGTVGPFVQSAYGDDDHPDFTDDDDLAFAADKSSLGKAVTAMIYQIGHTLGKDLHDVTDNDIRNHGLIVKINDQDDSIPQRPNRNDGKNNSGSDYDYTDYPRAVEPGDYYASQLPAHQFLKGTTLIRFLKRMNEWPRNWGPANPKSQNHLKGKLTNLALKHHPDKPKQDVLAKVHSLNRSELIKHLAHYQKLPR